MRVLLRDKDDRSLFVMEATTVAYDPMTRTLFCISADDGAAVSNISPTVANSFVQILFHAGKADLSEYDAAPFEMS